MNFDPTPYWRSTVGFDHLFDLLANQALPQAQENYPPYNIVRIDVQNVDEFGVLQPNAHYTRVFEFDILNHLVRKCEEVGSFTGAISDRKGGPPSTPSTPAGSPRRKPSLM